MSDSRPASTPPPNMIALPINMENARNSSEFANMTIGELLGKTKRMQNQVDWIFFYFFLNTLLFIV